MTADQLRKLGFDDAADALTEEHNEREARRVAAEHAAKNPHEPYITPTGIHIQRLPDGREVCGRTAEELADNVRHVEFLNRVAPQGATILSWATDNGGDPIYRGYGIGLHYDQ